MLAAVATVALLLAAGPPAPERSPVPGVRIATDGAPPAPLADPRRSTPVPGTVWLEGYWQWTGGKWAWVFGEWAVPPCRPACDFVPARWTSDDRGWTFHEPFWRPTAGDPRRIREAPFVPHLTASRPPPPLLVESPTRPPSRESVWIPGFWAWSGARYVWVAGDWSAPYPGHRWAEGYWKRAGAGFTWVEGRWRRS